MASKTYIVGATYHSAYWHYEYKVLAVKGVEVTVQLTKASHWPLKHMTIGEVWTHFTALDYRDHIVSPPR